MPGWCGSQAAGLCAFSTAASSLMLASSLGAVLAHLFSNLRSPQEGDEKPQRWTGGVLCCACFGLLVALHAASIAVLGALGAPPAHLYAEAAFLASWSLLLAAALHRGPLQFVRQLRALTPLAAILYCGTLFAHAWAADTGARAVFALVTSAAQLLASAAACIAALRAPRQLSELEQRLLDAEAGAAEDKRERSWYSLIGTALRHVWPQRRSMQARVVACFVIIAAQRLVNLAVPILYREVINRASEVTNAVRARTGSFTFMQVAYPFVLAYVLVAYVQGSLGSAGLLRALRSWLWQPVSQDAYKRISMLLFRHLLDLDLRFHLMRRTGEVSKVCDRGTDAMQDILSMVLFGSLPQLVDIAISCGFMATALQPWIALIVFVLLFTYIPLSVYLTEQKGRKRKEMNKFSNEQSSCLTDSLLNYETVKNFGNESVEAGKFESAIDSYQAAEYTMVISFNVVSLLQGTVVFCATVLGFGLCVKEIAAGVLTVGDLVLFLALMAQLYGPLNYFASLYRSIQKNMYNMDQMLELLEQEPAVKDAPDAREFQVGSCSLEFDHVSFGYGPDAEVLRDVSFRVEGGSTLALVGATGSGKSTALRLIFRYFDPSSGAIRIDGQDLRQVRLKSFRRHLAVVPQDTILFNMSIRDNIRYGRPGCSDAEVEAAAEASAIHEAITQRFPKGYDTVVGERGLRLSGGEKQRVALSRAILKIGSERDERSPAGMLLLDEATSALDTLTERRIQAALAEGSAARTTVVVAHRLSTIANADLIVVFQEGRVAEQGSHGELMERRGLYHELWTKQETGGGSAAEPPPPSAAADTPAPAAA